MVVAIEDDVVVADDPDAVVTPGASDGPPHPDNAMTAARTVRMQKSLRSAARRPLGQSAGLVVLPAMRILLMTYEQLQFVHLRSLDPKPVEKIRPVFHRSLQ